MLHVLKEILKSSITEREILESERTEKRIKIFLSQIFQNADIPLLVGILLKIGKLNVIKFEMQNGHYITILGKNKFLTLHHVVL